jgi:hypothetical protein
VWSREREEGRRGERKLRFLNMTKGKEKCQTKPRLTYLN